MRPALAYLCLAAALFGQGPESVLLVVNRASADSRAIGEYYRARRRIPAANVCVLDAPVEETVTRAVYDRTVAAGVRACLARNGLRERILYIATTLGVPLRIEGSGGRTGSQAAVDSELTLLYGAMAGASYPLSGQVRNPFFAQRDAPFSRPRFPIYLVTRLAAYDVGGVQAMIDRGLRARNRGVVVLDLDSDSDGTGNDWLRNAAILLPPSRVVFDESRKVLYGVKDVIGYASWGSNDSNRKARFPGFGWLPGAIATEYVSTNGRTFRRPPAAWTFSSWNALDRPKWWAGSPQSLAADYLEEGATGMSGHVYEPYLTTTPRPDHLFPAWLAGRTLAESYYLSIPALSWQNIVLGDPLCRLEP